MDTFPSAIPSVGVIVLAIGLAKSPEDINNASRFVNVATHLHPDEKAQILRFLREKKLQFQRISDQAFSNFESLLEEKTEMP